jgi:glycine oxidase
MRNDQLNRVETTDVIVVGGGVIGLAVARALNERGIARVTVVERAEPGAEASHAAGGMLAAQAEANEADALFELCVSSRELYPAWATSLLEETGIDIQLERTGTLYLAFTEGDEEESERRFQWQTKKGLPVERLTRNEARKLEPCVSPRVRSVLRFPLDVQVDNRRLVTALVSSLAKRQVQIMTGTHVKSLFIEDDRIAGIETDLNTIRAPIVVVANGAWASFLIISDSRVPPVRIEPVRGQMLCFRPTASMRHVLYSPRGYIIPRLSGQVLVGSTSDHVGFCKDVTGEGIHTIMTNALEIAPDVIRDALLVDSWAGLRPRAEDGIPVIGACHDIAGLFYATGHYRNGILLAPVTGELIADEITKGIAPEMLNAFSPNRFQTVTVG